jgi:hypothetical protein
MKGRFSVRLIVYPVLLFATLLSQSIEVSAYQTLGVTLYNMTNDQVTVTWPQYSTSNPNSPVDEYEESVSASEVLFLGQAQIPRNSSEEQSSFLIGIVDSASGLNLQFSISANNCQYDAYTWALSNFLAFCNNERTQDGSLMDGEQLLSYDINGSQMQVCLKGNPASGINNSVNYNVGITNNSPPSIGGDQAYCYQPDSGENNWLPIWFPTVDSTSNAFGANAQYYIALGSYAPSAGPPVNSLAFSGLSPTGVSPCIGSMCNIPSDTPNWPVTIYYYGVQGSQQGSLFPGFQYNGTSTPGSGQGLIVNDNQTTAWGQGAINVPSYLSNYGDAGSEDIYVTPASTFPDIQNLPMPCWPTVNESQQEACNGQPLFAKAAPPPPASIQSSLATAINDLAILLAEFAVF